MSKYDVLKKSNSEATLNSLTHPNFFVIGAAKSGTTSLWMYLKQHPEIFMPKERARKEPSYFCHLYGISDFNKYLKLFEGAYRYSAIGEASHAYLSSPESAKWIYDTYPNAKIIIVLRNPIERAYSLYNWMICEGYEKVYPFEAALEEEYKRIASDKFKYDNGQYYYNFLYYQSGLYYHQIKRYVDLFPSNQIRILLFENFVENTRDELKKLYRFLGVNDSFKLKTGAHNKRREVFSIPIQYYLKRHFHNHLSKVRIPYSAATIIQQKLMKYNIDLGKKLCRNRAKEETQRALVERYQEDIVKVEHLIDADLKKWYTSKIDLC
ncbi:MAG: sulfotransferase [Parerythrobacter sp.]